MCHLTVVILSLSLVMNRFSFRMAKTSDFWSFVSVFDGLQDTAALDRLSSSVLEHNCNMMNSKERESASPKHQHKVLMRFGTVN